MKGFLKGVIKNKGTRRKFGKGRVEKSGNHKYRAMNNCTKF